MESTPSPEDARHDLRVTLSVAAHAIAMYGLWFVLVGTASRTEAIAGVAVSVAGTIGTVLVRMQRVGRWQSRPGWIAQIWRMPRYAIEGTFEVMRVLTLQLFLDQPARSLFQCVRFDIHGERDAVQTRMALATAYTTMTPNFVVIGVDDHDGLLFYHQLTASPVPRMTERLGAKP